MRHICRVGANRQTVFRKESQEVSEFPQEMPRHAIEAEEWCVMQQEVEVEVFMVWFEAIRMEI